MRKWLRNIPNQLSIIRMLLIPILWVLAFMGQSYYLGILLFVAGSTDALDGWIARKFKLTSDLGSRLDSYADSMLIISMVFWMIMLEPEIPVEHPWLFWGLIIVSLASFLLGIVKFKRVANLHLYSAKISGVVGGFFFVHMFLVPGYNEPYFFLALGLYLISASEAFLMQLVLPYVDEHMGSILLVLLKRNSVARS